MPITEADWMFAIMLFVAAFGAGWELNQAYQARQERKREQRRLKELAGRWRNGHQ